jgi:hypothetical protein
LATSLLDPTVAAGIKHTFNLPTVAGYSGKFSDLTLERIRSSPDVRIYILILIPFKGFCYLSTKYEGSIGCLCRT